MQRVPDAFGGGDDDDAEEREFLHGFDRIEQRITLRNEAERRVKYAKGVADGAIELFFSSCVWG